MTAGAFRFISQARFAYHRAIETDCEETRDGVERLRAKECVGLHLKAVCGDQGSRVLKIGDADIHEGRLRIGLIKGILDGQLSRQPIYGA